MLANGRPSIIGVEIHCLMRKVDVTQQYHGTSSGLGREEECGQVSDTTEISMRRQWNGRNLYRTVTVTSLGWVCGNVLAAQIRLCSPRRNNSRVNAMLIISKNKNEMAMNGRETRAWHRITRRCEVFGRIA